MTKETLFEYIKTPSHENPTFARGRVTRTREEFCFTFIESVAALYIYPSDYVDVFRTYPADPERLRYSANFGLGSQDGRAGRTLIDGLLTHWLLDYAKKPFILLSRDRLESDEYHTQRNGALVKFVANISMRAFNVASENSLHLRIPPGFSLKSFVKKSADQELENVDLQSGSSKSYPSGSLDYRCGSETTFCLGLAQSQDDVQTFTFTFELDLEDKEVERSSCQPSAPFYFDRNPCSASISFEHAGKTLRCNSLSIKTSGLWSALHDY